MGIAITSDEESGGESGIGYLFKDEGVRCKSAMIPDGGSLSEVTVEEKGILHVHVSCDGHSAHAARPWFGKNPIDILMDKLNELRIFFSSLNEKIKGAPTNRIECRAESVHIRIS